MLECLEAYRSQNTYNNGEFILGAEKSLIPARMFRHSKLRLDRGTLTRRELMQGLGLVD